MLELVWQLPDGSRTKDAQGVQMTEQQMWDNISSSIVENQEKSDNMLKASEEALVAAEKILQEIDQPESMPVETKSSGARELSEDFWKTKRFHPQAALRPQKLERESNMLEVKHFSATCLRPTSWMYTRDRCQKNKSSSKLLL